MQVERTYGVVIEPASVQGLDRESLRDHIIDKVVAHYDALDEDDYKSEMAARWAAKHFDLDIDPKAIRADNAQDSFDKLFKEISARYEKREADAGEYIRRDPQTNEVIERELYMRQIERFLILKFIDELWKDHLLDMDQLKSGIGLRSYAQKDPKEEFKREGGDLFDKLIVSLMEKYTFFLFRAERSERISQSEVDSVWQESDQTTRHDSVQSVYSSSGGGSRTETERHEPEKTQTIVKKDMPKIGPNDRCPCGSGKKFKKCHGRPGAAPLTAEQIASWKTGEPEKSE
jgi:preprotein translocase subunit SecA